METNKELAFFIQVLTEKIIDFIHYPRDREFVEKTLEMTNACLEGKEVNPDLLYSRLENLDGQDIFTCFELDDISRNSVWTCLANAVVYICLLNYEQNGETYLPETIEAVDDETINAFFDSYRDCLPLFQSTANLKLQLLRDSRIDFCHPLIVEKYEYLFS